MTKEDYKKLLEATPQKPFINEELKQNKLANWHKEFNPVLKGKATGWHSQLPEVQYERFL